MLTAFAFAGLLADLDLAFPKSALAVTVGLAATMFALLGVDPETEVRDAFNRPLPVAAGRPVAEVLA